MLKQLSILSKLTVVNPTKQPCVMCKRLNTESGILKKIFVIVLGLFAQTAIKISLWRNIDCIHIAPTVAQKWIGGKQQCIVINADVKTGLNLNDEEYHEILKLWNEQERGSKNESPYN